MAKGGSPPSWLTYPGERKLATESQEERHYTVSAGAPDRHGALGSKKIEEAKLGERSLQLVPSGTVCVPGAIQL